MTEKAKKPRAPRAKKTPVHHDGREHPHRILYRSITPAEYLGVFLLFFVLGAVIWLAWHATEIKPTVPERDPTNYTTYCQSQGGTLFQLNRSWLCLNRKVVIFNE